MNFKTFMRKKKHRSLDSEVVSQMSCLKVTSGAVTVLVLVQGLLHFGLVLVCRVEMKEQRTNT